MERDYFMETIDRLILTGLSETEACFLLANLFEQLKEMLN